MFVCLLSVCLSVYFATYVMIHPTHDDAAAAAKSCLLFAHLFIHIHLSP